MSDLFPPTETLVKLRPAGPGTTAHVVPASNSLPERSSRQERRLMFILVGAVLLAPIPLGANRPLAWAALGMGIATITIWYSFVTLKRGWRSASSLRQLWPEALCFGIFCVYLLIQVSPIAQFPLQVGQLLVAARTISAAPGDTLLMLLRQLSYGAFVMLVLLAAAEPRRARWMIHALFLTIILHATAGLLFLAFGDTLLGFPKEAYIGFATGTFVNRNTFATFVAASLPIGVALLGDILFRSEWSNPWTKMVGCLAISSCLLVALSALAASGSRMGLFTGLCGALVVVLVLLVSGRRWLALAGIVLALGAVAAGSALLVPELFERMLQIRGSASERGALYGQVWAMIWTRPWIGFGGGSFATVFPAFQAPPLEGAFVWDKAHSTYLALWAEGGFLAGSLPMIVVALLAARAASAIRAPESFTASLAGLGGAVVFCLHSTLDFSLEVPGATILFLALLSVAAAPKAVTVRLPEVRSAP